MKAQSAKLLAKQPAPTRKGVVRRAGASKVVPLFSKNPGAYMSKSEVSWQKPKHNRNIAALVKPSAKVAMPDGYNPALVHPLALIDGLDFTPNDISDQTRPITGEWALKDMMIDHNWQRELTGTDIALIKQIASGWRWAKMQPLCGFLIKGKLYLTDGQKTATAAKHRGDIETLPGAAIEANSVGEALHELAGAFIALNTVKVPVPKVDIFTAAIMEGDEISLKTREILNRHDIRVISAVRSDRIEFASRQTMLAATFLDMVRHKGPEYTDSVCEILAPANLRPIRREHILAAQYILRVEKERKNKFDRAKLTRAITKHLDKYDLQDALIQAGRKSIPKHHALAEIYIKRYATA